MSGRRFAALLLALSLPIASLLAAGCGDSRVTGVSQPPTVTLTAPAPAVTVSPVGFAVRAVATDDDGVARVDFYVDTTLVASIAVPPYEAFVTALGLDSTAVHALRAVAIDTDDLAAADTVGSIAVRPRSYRQLTFSPGGQRSFEPAWRPDGQEIAFARQGTIPNSTKNVYVVSAGGGVPVQVTSSLLRDGNPSYSPDGGWIAFESDRSASYQIFVVNPTSGKTVQLTSVGGGANQRRPSWSTTTGLDSWIAYESDRSGRRDIYMTKVTPEPDTVRIAAPETFADSHDAMDYAPAWSHGSALAIGSNRNGAFAVVIVDPFLALGALQVAGTNAGLVEDQAATFSPLDTHVAFVEEIAGQKVWAVPVLGSGAVRHDVAPGDLGFPDAFDPAWSPDGSRIAFVSTRTGVAEVWILE